MNGWKPDVLGSGFEQLTLNLGHDDEGELVATLVRALPEKLGFWKALVEPQREFENIDVLYVHGWSDYFFQKDLARFWTERGAHFYALDLRKYGRSLREGQTAGYIEDLAEYDLEIDHALNELPDRTGRRLVLMGHSTGGLILSLWANRNPGIASAMILNSPWLEFQLSGVVRKLLSPLLDMNARIRPHEATPQIDYGFYSKAQKMVSEARDTVVEFNEKWRPPQSMPVRNGWIRAILEGHEQIERGLDIDVPVCVMLSRRSIMPNRWTEELMRADSVINVTEVAKASLSLASSVTIVRVDGALHDIFLSATRPRQEAYRRMESWMRGFLAVDRG